MRLSVGQKTNSLGFKLMKEQDIMEVALPYHSKHSTIETSFPFLFCECTYASFPYTDTYGDMTEGKN